MELTRNSYNCFIEAGVLDNTINPRLELQNKSWPNVIFESGLTVRLSSNVTYLRIFYLSSDVTYPNGVGYMSFYS